MKNKVRIVVLLWLAVLLFLVLSVLGWFVSDNELLRDIFVIVGGGGVLLNLAALNRLVLFEKKLSLALRHLQENNYQTGISLPGVDEPARIARSFNHVVDQINEYDRLRENKVVVLNRLIVTSCRLMSEALMIIDTDAGIITLNPPCQKMFGISRDEVTIGAVSRLSPNAPFNRLYRQILNGTANAAADTIELHLPSQRARAQVNLKMFGIKNKEEELKKILCVLIPA